jgi:hypothetical protein
MFKTLWDSVGLCMMDNHSTPTNNHLCVVQLYSESHVTQHFAMSDGRVRYGMKQSVAQ